MPYSSITNLDFAERRTLNPSLSSGAMAKNRNKKKQNNGSVAMVLTSDQEAIDVPQVDTSESTASKSSFGGPHRKMKGLQMKRSKNVRKMKAIAKAISKSEQSVEKVLKSESKTTRIQSAKKLYD